MIFMKKSACFVSFVLIVTLFIACSDDDSNFISQPNGKCDVGTDDNCFKDIRDGQTYRIVKIGEQNWMAENLNLKTDNSYCYHDSTENCTKYGRLYTWAAAMDSVGKWSSNSKGCGNHTTCSPTYPVQGVCPEGWHLPSKAEFETLFSEVGGNSTAGPMLKSTTDWKFSGNGTDTYAFSALPAGARYYKGDNDKGYRAHFWSSTEDSSGTAYLMTLGYSNVDGILRIYVKNYGLSVRCLKD